jgi:hypothetical protein
MSFSVTKSDGIFTFFAMVRTLRFVFFFVSAICACCDTPHVLALTHKRKSPFVEIFADNACHLLQTLLSLDLSLPVLRAIFVCDRFHGPNHVCGCHFQMRSWEHIKHVLEINSSSVEQLHSHQRALKQILSFAGPYLAHKSLELFYYVYGCRKVRGHVIEMDEAAAMDARESIYAGERVTSRFL